MKALIPCVILWVLCVWVETFITGPFTLSNPNLFFLVPMIFILRWRGIESYTIAIIFGLTSDSFSSLPFGTNGLGFFLMAFPLRFYGIKIFQFSSLTLPITIAFFTAFYSLIQFGILNFFSTKGIKITDWLNHYFFSEILWTSIFSYPVFQIVVRLEKKFNIHLAERIF
ncbi:MAG: rod shape-determining protein MreD [Proteobacteria bacterium]|nr:rod shape-determining protein MreD [Pseudomonadota bacterium]